MRNIMASLFGLLGIGLGLGVPIYWWITYSGIYRWLAEVQLGWFDGYYAMLTGVLSLAVGCVVFIPPLLWLAARVEPPDAAPAPETPPERSVELVTPEEADARAVRTRSTGCLVVLLIVIIPVVGIGIWQLFDANRLGEKRVVELAQLEAEVAGGSDLPSRWVEFAARPAWLETAGVKEKNKTTRYVPVRSLPERDAVIALELPKDPPAGRRRWTGTLSVGAPGVIVSAFARAGRVRDPVWVLAVDNTPEKTRRIGWSMLKVGGGLLGIGLIVIGVLRRRWRRAGK